jgi:hypothetical protein
MKWFIYAALQMLCMVVCYLTNWIVAIFANEEGELPGCLRLWQTWDDTLDNETDIKRMPKFLRYNWNDHYVQVETTERGQRRYMEFLFEPFTLKDRIRRYFCRCHWLYRNCGYGFAFYWFGVDVEPPVNATLKDDWYFLSTDKAWAFKSSQRAFCRLRWKVYLGWKIQRQLNKPHRAMIATRVWFQR